MRRSRGPRQNNPRDAVLRLLAHRPRSEEELRRLLRGKGVSAGDIERLLIEFRDLRLVDDEAFARMVVDSILGRKPVGRHWLAAKLRRFFLSPEQIQQVLDECLPCEHEIALAREAAAGQEGARARDRGSLRVFLLRRGFSPEVVDDVLERGREGLDDGTRRALW